MSWLGTAVIAMKSANSTLNTLVGTRCRPEVLKQGEALPAMTYQEITRQRDHTWGVALPPLSHPLVMMKGCASTDEARATLAAAMRLAFSTVTSQSIGGITVQGAQVVNEFSGGVQRLDSGAEAWVWIMYVQFHIKE